MEDFKKKKKKKKKKKTMTSKDMSRVKLPAFIYDSLRASLPAGIEVNNFSLLQYATDAAYTSDTQEEDGAGSTCGLSQALVRDR